MKRMRRNVYFLEAITTVSLLVFLLLPLFNRRVECHVPPNQDYYYGRRVNFKPPSSQVYETIHRQAPFSSSPTASPSSVNNFKYYPVQGESQRPQQYQPSNLKMPTCGQLEDMWRSTVIEFTNTLGFFVFPNDVERILTNPSYRNLILYGDSEPVVASPSMSIPSEGNTYGTLSFSSLASHPPSLDSGHFGQVVYERQTTTSTTPAPKTFNDRKPVFGTVIKEGDQSSLQRGNDVDREQVTYGHVILSPEEAVKHLPEEGKFGDIVENSPPETFSPIFEIVSGNVASSFSSPSQSTSNIRGSLNDEPKVEGSEGGRKSKIRKTASSKGRTSTPDADSNGGTRSQDKSKSSLTASDFFNSRWHDGPVKF